MAPPRLEGPEDSAHVGAICLALEPLVRLTNLPDQWLQCQANSPNVYQVPRRAETFRPVNSEPMAKSTIVPYLSFLGPDVEQV